MVPVGDFNPCPKPDHKRGTPKRVNRGKFSQDTIQKIGERDGWKCVRCHSTTIESVPHHVIFKSQGGPGTVDNGVSICRGCHDWAHGKRKGPAGEPAKEGRKWFEQYRIDYLISRQ